MNDNPVANADTATTAEDIALNNINVSGNQTDAQQQYPGVDADSALKPAVDEGQR